MFCSFFFFKQMTAYEMRISDWSSDVCSSDLDVTCRSAATGVGRLRLVGTTFTISGYVGDAVRNDILPSGHEPQVPQQKHHELRLEAVIGFLGSSADEIPEYVTVGYSCGFHRTQDIASCDRKRTRLNSRP